MTRPLSRLITSTLVVGTLLLAACAPAAPAAAPTSAAQTTAPKPTTAPPPTAAPPATSQPAVAATTAPAAPAAAKPTTAPSGQPTEVVIAQPADAPTYDPQKPGGPFGNNMFINLFDPVTFFDASGKIVPHLATEWSRVSDKQWRFKLRQDVKFTNGEEFDANSVKYTIDRMLQPGAVRALYTFGVLERAEVVDKYTVDVFTKQPDPLVPNRMTDLYVLPPKYAAQVGEDEFGKKPVGTGAYKLSESLPNQRAVMEANATYWQGKPAVDKVVWRTIPESSTRLAELLSGGVDLIIDLTPEQAGSIKSNPRARALTIQSKRVPYVGMNLLDNGPKELKDKRVRQALNYAVDVNALVNTVLGGYGNRVATIFRPDFFGYDASITAYPHDPAKAKQLLAEAGYPNGFSMTLQTSDGIILKGLEITQAIGSQLAAVGVKAEVQPLELNAFRGIVIGGQQQGKVTGAFLWNWGAKPGEVDSALSGFIQTGAISSYYSNADMDKMIDSARQEQDPTARAAKYKQIQEMLKDDAPVIFLYQAHDLYGASDRLSWEPRLDQFVIGREMTAKPK